MGGNVGGRPQGQVASIWNNPVSQYTSGSNSPFQDAYGFGDMTSGGGQGGEGGMFGFGGDNMFQTIGARAGIAKDLFGIYSAMQGLDMAKTGINNRATAYNNNAQNQQNFTNGVIDVFGSGQNRTNNQMAQKV